MRPARERPALTATIGFFSADPPGDLAEPARVPEALEIQQDDVGARIVGPVLDQIVARHIGLVAH